MMTPDNLADGAKNLLLKCAELDGTETLLIVCESPELGWYDDTGPAATVAAAQGMGIRPTVLNVGAPENVRDPRLVEAMDNHDCSIFFARIGDQDRFAEPVPGKKTVMSYARTEFELASAYGRADHKALVELKQAVNDILLGADVIQITCPHGTDITGNASQTKRENLGDVSVRRFPMGVPQPLDASGMSGRVALSRYLTPTGSKTYEPPSVPIEGIVMVDVSQGRIGGFEGDAGPVAEIRNHYKMVSEKFGIDADVIHSFHAGIHPGNAYNRMAEDDPDRWSNSVFTNPRILHFHTCGDYAPGEICWMLIDHTLTVDGKALWLDGRLCVETFEQTARCLDDWPDLRPLFDSPSRAIGLKE